MIHGSLFSGIGGFDLGFERAGIKTVFQVEIDAYCRAVLASHFPDAERFEDIRDCCGIQGPHRCARKHHLRWVDILSGGFPCQDISNAGKREGIDGDRSGIWSEYARIIRELRPQFVVVENVAALLGRGMERVLGDLAACGYDAEWQSIRASDVGAPHRRERIWIVAYPQGNLRRAFRDARSEASHRRDTFLADTDSRRFAVQGESSGRGGLAARGGEIVADAEFSRLERFSGHGEGGTERQGPNGSTGKASVCDSTEQRLSHGPIFAMGEPGTHSKLERSDWWAVEPNVGRVAHGVPARVDRLKGLGNAIVPQIAEFIGRQIVEAGKREMTR